MTKEKEIRVPLWMAEGISRYLGTRPFDEVGEVLPLLRRLIADSGKRARPLAAVPAVKSKMGEQ